MTDYRLNDFTSNLNFLYYCYFTCKKPVGVQNAKAVFSKIVSRKLPQKILKNVIGVNYSNFRSLYPIYVYVEYHKPKNGVHS
jgi:hypothetical protein